MDTDTIQQPAVDRYIGSLAELQQPRWTQRPYNSLLLTATLVVSLSYNNQGGHRHHTPACCWLLHWWSRWVTTTKMDRETIHQPVVDCYIGGTAELQKPRWTQRPYTSLLLTDILVVSLSYNQDEHRDHALACCWLLYWWSRRVTATKVDTETIHWHVVDYYIDGLAELQQPRWTQGPYTSLLLIDTLVVLMSYNNQGGHRDHKPAWCWPLHWWSRWVTTTKVDTETTHWPVVDRYIGGLAELQQPR